MSQPGHHTLKPVTLGAEIRVCCQPDENMTSIETDAQLIDRVVRHDERDAFGELVRRHQSPVRSFLRKLTCGDTALADDLAQETFVRAYLGLKGFRGDARFSTWLTRIAYNLFLMEVRRVSRKRESLANADSEPVQAHSLDQKLDLERAMEHLTEAERASLALCYSLGMSHTEAADVLGCPVGTVKTHVLRGKEKLRKRLVPDRENQKERVHDDT